MGLGIFRHFTLVKMNPTLDVPIIQRYTFMFVFSRWNVNVLLNIRMSEVEGWKSTPELTLIQCKHKANLFFVCRTMFFRLKQNSVKVWNKGEKEQADILNECISSPACHDSFYVWVFCELKETSEKARQTNKTTFEQNTRESRRQQYVATGHSTGDLKFVASSFE